MSKIEYDLIKIKGIVFDVDGVLSPSTCTLSTSGRPLRQGNVKDGFAMQLAVKHGIKIAVITGGESLEMANRMMLLGIKDYFQCIPEKLPVLQKWMSDNGLSKENVAYMGDDLPDLPCLREVGLPSSPADAAWEIRNESIFVSSFNGGYGAARDLIEQVLKAHELWDTEASASHIW